MEYEFMGKTITLKPVGYGLCLTYIKRVKDLSKRSKEGDIDAAIELLDYRVSTALRVCEGIDKDVFYDEGVGSEVKYPRAEVDKLLSVVDTWIGVGGDMDKFQKK